MVALLPLLYALGTGTVAGLTAASQAPSNRVAVGVSAGLAAVVGAFLPQPQKVAQK